MTPDDRSRAWMAGLSAFPALAVRDLSPERQSQLGQHVLSLIRESERRGKNNIDSILYLAALDHFGCICPHVDNPCRHCGTVTIYAPQRGNGPTP